jgi:hypothetical protein
VTFSRICAVLIDDRVVVARVPVHAWEKSRKPPTARAKCLGALVAVGRFTGLAGMIVRSETLNQTFRKAGMRSSRQASQERRPKIKRVDMTRGRMLPGFFFVKEKPCGSRLSQ